MKQLKNKGSALQIVLVTFLIMLSSLTICIALISHRVTNYHLIQTLMKQKNLEIMLVEYYCQQMQDGFLMSDDYSDDDISIDSLVDDMGNYYEITTHIEGRDMNYTFIVQISTDTQTVFKFEYKEE